MDELKLEIFALGQVYADAIHSAYELRCSCGEGEDGERSCKHCDACIDAKWNFERDIGDALSRIGGNT